MKYVLLIQTIGGRTLGTLHLDLHEMRRHEIRARLLSAIEDVIENDFTPEAARPIAPRPCNYLKGARSFAAREAGCPLDHCADCGGHLDASDGCACSEVKQ